MKATERRPGRPPLAEPTLPGTTTHDQTVRAARRRLDRWDWLGRQLLRYSLAETKAPLIYRRTETFEPCSSCWATGRSRALSVTSGLRRRRTCYRRAGGCLKYLSRADTLCPLITEAWADLLLQATAMSRPPYSGNRTHALQRLVRLRLEAAEP
jgi:hypothetical protein